jgi:hypothetical protein
MFFAFKDAVVFEESRLPENGGTLEKAGQI